MHEIEKTARTIVSEAADKLSPIEFIRFSVASMSRGDVEHLAAAYLMLQVKGNRRRAVLAVEREAERNAEPRWGTVAWDVWAQMPDNAEAVARRVELRRDIAEGEALARKELSKVFQDAVAKLRSTLRLEWTTELLDAEFSLADGTSVRWGDATRDQHEQRYQMHARNAMAGMEGAARHQAALVELEVSGAPTLRVALSMASYQ